MKALLDTHAIIWAVNDDPQLGKAARDLISAAGGKLLAISDITLLEMAMLAAKGRIACQAGVATTLKTITRKVAVIPIDAAIAAEAMELALPNGDPFDRIIVATARQRKLPILTRDRAITESGLVETIW